jgi:isoleucyl-tRNA synthetase
MKKKKDYKETLNLPKTDFPMKADLPRREPSFIERWDRKQLYEKVRGKKKGGTESFILHDGPPYANGHIHMGTALNKVLKDLVVKSKTMLGYHSPYRPGWDCHGLPIEHQVDKLLGERKKELSQIDVRRECRKFAEKFVAIQREEFRRLGVLGEWKNPYLTIDPEYEATIIRQFGEFVARGDVYKGYKPVHWCFHCKTALAEAEVEYYDHTSPSIFVKFKAGKDFAKRVPALAGKKAFVLIWTTTPWTLPANLAIALHPDYDYVALEVGDEVYIVARELASTIADECGFSGVKEIASIKGKELERATCRHPFIDRDSLIVLGDFVTLEQGTGCVHSAPGHGADDYMVGTKYGLDIYAPVDDDGRFTREVEHFAGLNLFEANPKIIDLLNDKGMLVGKGEITHSYPHCWRCKNPVIFRATEQWFISMDKNKLRDKTAAEVSKVSWIPEWGEERIRDMIMNRPDWCISRQRSWGVPIPVFYCRNCHHPLLEKRVIDFVADIFSKEGSDAWFTREEEELMPDRTRCPECGGNDFEKELDILDVWFESGVSHAAVLGHRKDLPWPSDLYLEGTDQYRGWFQSSLLTAVEAREKAPYQTVITHGFVVDAEGRKMSKSLGNIIFPDEIINKYGAEVLRLWVAMMDYRDDIRISAEIIERIAEAYRKIRNTCRFMLGNLYDFDPEGDAVAYSELSELDRFALYRFDETAKRIVKAYENYNFHIVYHSLLNLCTVDLSAFYLDIIKDRLYVSPPDDVKRRAAQTALYKIAKELAQIMAPILSFTAEEVWDHLPGKKEESVHLSSFPKEMEKPPSDFINRWERLLALRGEIFKALEIARKEEKIINHSLDAEVVISAKEELISSLRLSIPELRDIFIISKLTLAPLSDALYHSEDTPGLKIDVRKAAGEKCQRCWKYSEGVGKGACYNDVCSHCHQVLEELEK